VTSSLFDDPTRGAPLIAPDRLGSCARRVQLPANCQYDRLSWLQVQRVACYVSNPMGDAKRMEAEAAIARANASFYRAFTEGSYEKMSDLWARNAPVACVHPGSPPIAGRNSVLESWRLILREPPPLAMRCDRVVVRLFGEAAVVTCYEGNGDHPAHLAATNVFVHEGGSWRMVHHHAGPLSRSIPNASPPASSLN
jgi:hypothetical protein